MKTSIGPSVWMIFLCSLLFAPFANANSSIFSFDTSDSGIKTSNPALTPTELWNFTAANTTASTIRTNWIAPIVADGVAYINTVETYTIPNEKYHDHFGFGPPQHSLTNLYALNVSSGNKLWNFTNHPGAQTLAVINGNVYLGSGGNLYALEAANGTQKWIHQGSGGFFLWSQTIINDVIYIAANDQNHDNYVYALNATSGDDFWNYALQATPYSTPVIVDGVVYFRSGSNLYALNAENGTERWNYNTGESTISNPALLDGVMYFGAGNEYYALNTANGEKTWSSTIGHNILLSPIIVGSTIYLSTTDLEILALDASNGIKLWNYTTNNRFLSPLTVSNGIVYFSSGGNLCALSAANGAQIWNYNTSSTSLSSTIVNGVVYSYSDNNFYALNAANGDRLWSYAVSGNVRSSTIVDSVAYFVEGNTIYALGIPVGLSPAGPSSSPSPTASVAIVSGLSVTIIGLVLLVYFKKRKR